MVEIAATIFVLGFAVVAITLMAGFITALIRHEREVNEHNRKLAARNAAAKKI